MLLQPLVFLLKLPKVAPVVSHAPASRGRLCCRGGLTAPYYSHRWPGPAATAASHRSRTSEPSYSSPRGLPLPHLPWLRVVPFLGLAVIHRRGALRAAWSTWSRNDFHRTWTVRGEADSWVHGRSKEVPPYYAQQNEYPLLAGTHHSGRMTCGPTKLTGTEGFVNLVNMNDSSSSDRMMSIQWP